MFWGVGEQGRTWEVGGPLGLSLYPAVSGGRDIVLGDRFRTKLAYTPPLLYQRRAWM
jgi:hypothetical protein